MQRPELTETGLLDDCLVGPTGLARSRMQMELREGLSPLVIHLGQVGTGWCHTP